MSLYDEIASNNRVTALLFIAHLFFYFIIVYAFFVVIGIEPDVIMSSVLAAILFGIFYYFTFSGAGSRMLLALSGAMPVTKDKYPYLVNAVEALSIGAGIPTPQIHVIESNALNAFATGPDPAHAHVVVTTGLLNKMNRLELEGVLAHEISHIKNYDVRTMLVAAVLGLVIALIANIGLRMLRTRSSGGSRKGKGFILLFAVIGLILAPTISLLIRMAISRNREYAADASAAMLTRYPEGLASALEKIKKAYEENPAEMPGANDATRHLYIFDPMQKSLTALFSTHPPIEDRIKRLRAM